MSTAYIWWNTVYPITIYVVQDVQEIHNFHVVLPALHPVAPDMKQERRLDAEFEFNVFTATPPVSSFYLQVCC
jgi:hypothetical protein